MPEKPPAFVVVDKRKYTAEGEIREGYTAPPVEERTPEPDPLAGAASAAATTAGAAAGEAYGSSAKVVTMPSRSTVEADDVGIAEDLREPAQVSAGYDADGYGIGPRDGIGLEDEADFEGEDAELGPPPSAAETAAQHTAYRQSSREMDTLLQQSNPGMKTPAAVGFEHIVQSFYLSAIMAMGAGAEPGQKPRIDILGARQAIDMLSVLEEKTRGNLDEKEQRLVQGVTFELRMMFLELTNAIAKQAQQAPPPSPLGRR